MAIDLVFHLIEQSDADLELVDRETVEQLILAHYHRDETTSAEVEKKIPEEVRKYVWSAIEDVDCSRIPVWA